MEADQSRGMESKDLFWRCRTCMTVQAATDNQTFRTLENSSNAFRIFGLSR